MDEIDEAAEWARGVLLEGASIGQVMRRLDNKMYAMAVQRERDRVVWIDERDSRTASRGDL